MHSVKKTLTSLLLTAGVFQLPLTAELLVYEGFSGYNTTETLNGQAATGTGLTGNWGGTTDVNVNFTDTGLTFGSLNTTGGAASFSIAGRATAIAGAQLDLSSPVTGTLYSSMLFNFSAVDSGLESLSSMRVATNQSLSSGDSPRLSTYARSQQQTSYRPGVDYNSGSIKATGQTLAADTTYMAISIFTNVGTALSAGNQGVASVYVLTEAQFEDFAANGRSEANLTGRATGSGADQIIAFASESLSSGTYSFNSGNFMGLASYSRPYEETLAGTYDELRWSTDLDSVAVIPEPGTLALAGGLSALALVLFRRRRR